MQRPRQSDRRQPAPRTGRQSAVRPGDRRDGAPLIFGWGRHLTRAEKQRYRERFVWAAGGLVLLIVAIVLAVGAFQNLYQKPRYAVARVNGDTITLDWYNKNLSYKHTLLQTEYQNTQNQLQALTANVAAAATATATALGAAGPTTPTPGPSSGASTSGQAAGASSSSARVSGSGSSPSTSAGAAAAVSSGPSTAAAAPGSANGQPAASGSPTATATLPPTSTPTVAPTFNPVQSATAAALQNTLDTDNTAYSSAEEQTVDDLLDADLMRQNASKFGITVSNDDVSAQEKKDADTLGGDTGVKNMLQNAKISQGDYDQIEYNVVLKQKFQTYFAANPGAAPTATATVEPTPSLTEAPVTGPVPPTPTATPTPVPTPGADSLESWLEVQRSTANIYRAPFPLPS
ncbi:MAG: hypothetical protein JO247_01605 [Chloroflexi bacterium]|nr:hypothetical protein [Chloroflexota bacterium]